MVPLLHPREVYSRRGAGGGVYSCSEMVLGWSAKIVI